MLVTIWFHFGLTNKTIIGQNETIVNSYSQKT